MLADYPVVFIFGEASNNHATATRIQSPSKQPLFCSRWWRRWYILDTDDDDDHDTADKDYIDQFEDDIFVCKG